MWIVGVIRRIMCHTSLEPYRRHSFKFVSDEFNGNEMILEFIVDDRVNASHMFRTKDGRRISKNSFTFT